MNEVQKMGMITKIWGPAAWLFLHAISFNYYPERKEEYKQFFKLLAFVLPCKKCRENYHNLISKGDLKMTNKIFKSRDTFSYWLFKLHNKVQNDIFVKSELDCERPMYENNFKDYLKVKNIYESFRAKCTKKMYGCTVPKKGIKLRTQIIIKPFNSKCAKQKLGMLITKS